MLGVKGFPAVAVIRRWRHALAAAMLALPLWICSAPAAAMDIQPLINDLCQYHVLDSDTCSAQAVIDCLVQSGGKMGAMQQCAAQYDPSAQKFIAIYGAATKPDYVRLIELAGPVVACRLLPPGPPQSMLCGELLQPIAALGFSTAAQFYQAAVSKNWPRLLYLAGPGLGCKALDVIGGVPGNDVLCGTLARIIEEGVALAGKSLEAGKDVLEYGAGLVVDGAEALSDLLGGGKSKPRMSEQEYYQRVVRPWLHQRALMRVAHNAQAMGLAAPAMKNCLGYYPPVLYQERCDRLSKRLHAEADAVARIVATAPAAHYATQLAPLVADTTAEQYWGGVEAYRQFVNNLPMKDWHPGRFWVGTDKGIAKLMIDCQKEMIRRIPGPLAPGLTDALVPPSFWNWACYQAVGRQFSDALVVERARLHEQVRPGIQSAGCVAQKTSAESKSLYFKCASFAAWATCQQNFHRYRYTHCSVDGVTAEKGLAQKVAQTLGSKRCTYVENVGAGLSPAVRCSRPYKHQACKTIIARHKSDSHGKVGTHVQCQLQEDADFLNGRKKVQALLEEINGAASPPVTAGAPRLRRMTTPPCSTTWDPLAIRCRSPDAIAAHQVTLPACPLFDPNRDGVDAPCLVQDLRITLTANAPVGRRTTQLPVQPAPSAGAAATRMVRAQPDAARAAQPVERAKTPVLTSVVGRIRPTVLRIEAEGLLAERAVQLRGGQASAQPMSGFGPGWGGDTQLFWHGGAVGAVLALMVDVPQDGAWIVEIDLTRAPDYGQLAFEVDRHRVSTAFDGYAPGVAGPVTVTLGTFAMRAGRRPVSLIITGRNTAATGYLAGVDRILLKPAGD
jgi:hypothetical protein